MIIKSKTKSLFIFFILIISTFSFAFLSVQSKNNLLNSKSNYEDDLKIYAVIIAVGDVLRDKNNVNEFKRILNNNDVLKEDIFSLIDENATKEKILNEPFDWLGQKDLSPNDIVIFYFSMHGSRIKDIKPFDEPDTYDECLLPYDFNSSNKDKKIVDEELNNSFSNIQINNLVLIFETCYSGGMIDGDNDLKKDGRIILTSSKEDETSWGTFFTNSWLFPRHLFKAFLGKADKNNDFYISAEEAFFYSKRPTIFWSFIFASIYSLIPFIPHNFYAQHPQIFDGWPSINDNSDELILFSY